MSAIRYTNARVPRCFNDLPAGESLLVDVDIRVEGGRIREVEALGGSPVRGDASGVDFGGRVLFPGFVDAHVHLDKAFTWDRAPNVRGEFWDAIELLSRDKVNWTEDDLYRRGGFALRCAAAHGTVAMRTHVDTGVEFGDTSHAVMQQLREEWAGRVELQTVSLCGIEQYSAPGGIKIAERTLRYPNSLLGGMPQMGPDLQRQLDFFFDLAADLKAGVDLHVDENGLAEAECLRQIAETVLRKSFPYPVTCGHVCSLAVQPLERALSTIDLVKQAGIHIISLPLCNLYLQGRPAEVGQARATPRWRGVTLLHEFVDAGVLTACASDNVRDAFYAWGDFDLFEVFNQSVRIAHLDTRLEAACAMVTETPARIMALEGFGRIAPGYDARMVAFEATSFNELLSRPGQTRQVLGLAPENGASAPPYGELLSCGQSLES